MNTSHSVSTDDIINHNAYTPLPIDFIPNIMGINISQVHSIEWEKQPDDQLVNVTINFTPEAKEDHFAEDKIITLYEEILNHYKGESITYEDIATLICKQIIDKSQVNEQEYFQLVHKIFTICQQRSNDIYSSLHKQVDETKPLPIPPEIQAMLDGNDVIPELTSIHDVRYFVDKLIKAQPELKGDKSFNQLKTLVDMIIVKEKVGQQQQKQPNIIAFDSLNELQDFLINLYTTL